MGTHDFSELKDRRAVMDADDIIAELRAENNMLKGVLAQHPEMRDVVGHLRALNAELQAGAYTAMRNRLADLLRRFDRESQT